jgi:hypothetical protein
VLDFEQDNLTFAPVFTDFCATSDELKLALKGAFPKLSGVDFYLLRALTGGKGKAIVRISNTESVPSVAHLRASKASKIYVKPQVTLLPVRILSLVAYI